MKKISFNDKSGLTKAVLEGRKTQTRRIIKMPDYDEEYLDTAFDWDLREMVIIDRYAKYKVGEIVAVAQSYRDCGGLMDDGTPRCSLIFSRDKGKGWDNKMFVRAELMPHRIRITNVRVERLQDISNKDCIAEGIEKMLVGCEYYKYSFLDNGKWSDFNTPREAYASLIDKIIGKGTYEKNPYVFVYDFELIK